MLPAKPTMIVAELKASTENVTTPDEVAKVVVISATGAKAIGALISNAMIKVRSAYRRSCIFPPPPLLSAPSLSIGGLSMVLRFVQLLLKKASL